MRNQRTLFPQVKRGEQTTNTNIITYEIYQLKPDISNHEIAFMSLEYLEEKGIKVERERYELVYRGTVVDSPDILDHLYLKFNTDQPSDFTGHSLSISDIVVINKGINSTAYYVDKIGFTEVACPLK
ncbi:MAG: hypothetical protein LIO49_01550 [Ruminococcus sp.]|nr:hypothetical protein [Ruminococcus sp.]